MFYIGIDDTDSIKGMCTTYIGALLADELKTSNQKLVRLNPNIKWKTRGNASICLELKKERAKVKEKVLEAVERYAEFEGENTHPGVVFLDGDVPKAFSDFYRKCLQGVAEIKEAEDLAESYGAEVCKFKKGRGIIGAIAAIGSAFDDRTYEIIAYRERENWGRERRIDKASVYGMDSKTFPFTFNNVDGDRILITPHSPCPVLFGIRGENPEILQQAYEMVVANEGIERKIIYMTNQGTDAHLRRVEGISEVEPFSSVILKGRVAGAPKTISGGHVIFPIGDGRGEIDCAAYEPTGDFRKIVRKLMPGDLVEAYGGVRSDGKTINLEKIQILKLAEIYREENPLCGCGRRMESAGRAQGFRCKKCRTHRKEKVRRKVERGLKEGIYQVPPRAMRHLSKPLIRF
jgi:tRNA(Ile2)-agmatinylcytidine synthase